jgi:uncharacterized protein (TIGR02217 family)
MSFHDVLFPEHLSFGTRGGTGFSTAIKPSDSGVERRSKEWEGQRGRVQYDISKAVQTEDDIGDLLSFYMCMRGSACGFRFKDPADFTSDDDGTTVPTAEVARNPQPMIGRVDDGNQFFTLNKQYRDKHYANNQLAGNRAITRPIPPGSSSHAIYIYLGGQLVWKSDTSGSGTQAQGYVCAVDYDTGRVHIDPAPAVQPHAEFTFHVPARFGEEVDAGMDVSWNSAGEFSLGAVTIVEITSDISTGAEEWHYGGATTRLQAGENHHQVGAFSVTASMLQAYYPSMANSSVTLEQLNVGAAVPSPKRYSPMLNGENFMGGPVVLLWNSKASGTFGGDYVLVNRKTETGFKYLLKILAPDQYLELYWLGQTLGYTIR